MHEMHANVGTCNHAFMASVTQCCKVKQSSKNAQKMLKVEK